MEADIKELGMSIGLSFQLWCDNLTANYLIVNLIFHTKMKHVARHYHFVVAKKIFEAKFICPKEQLTAHQAFA